MKTGEGGIGGAIGAGKAVIHAKEYGPHAELPVPEISSRRKQANHMHPAMSSLTVNWPVPLAAPEAAMQEYSECHFYLQMRNSAQKNSNVRRNSGRAGRWFFQNGIILFFTGEENE